MAHVRIRNRLPGEVAKNKEDIRLIHLHCKNADTEYVEVIMKRLSELNPAAEVYTDFNLCLKVVKLIRDERLFIIVSDVFTAENLLNISAVPTVVAIFVLSTTEQCQVSKAENKKIIKIFRDAESLMKSICKTMCLVQKNTLAFSLFNGKQTSVRDLTNESISFLWYQLLIYVLKQIPNEHEPIREMVTMCYDYYQENEKELNKIKDFENSYTPETAIHWYTDDCFLYRLLNRALRTEDIQLLYIFRFYIIDLSNEIEEESLKATGNDRMTLYRGQEIPNDEIKKLIDNVGNLISFNGFVSTTRSKEIALKFAQDDPLSNGFERVLFEIEVDRSLVTARFADVLGKSKFKGEQEVLFTMNACFKIVSFEHDSLDNLWIVQLKATDEDSDKFQKCLESIKEQMIEHTPLIYYGRLVLYEFGRVNQAKGYFNKLKKSLPTNHPALASVYDHLGHVHNQSDELDLALKNFKRAYRIHVKSLPSHHPYIARSLQHLGIIYERKGDLETALNYYRQASVIHNRHYPGDHLEKALVLESMGIIYRAKRDLDMALSFLSRALAMYQRVLIPQHHQIAQCLGYLGLVYEDKNKLKIALKYYLKQLEMEEQCLPSDHWRLYAHIGWIVHVQMKMDHRDKAWKFCQEKCSHAERTLGTTHLHVAQMQMIMAELVENDNPDQALNFYKKAESILKASIESDDRLLSQCFLAMANWYTKDNQLHKALKYDMKAVKHVRQCLPSDHIDLAFSLKNLGMSFRVMDNIRDANDCFSESLSIYRANYGSEHIAMNLYSRIIAELIEEKPETNRSEPQQHISVATNQKNGLNSTQQSLQLDRSTSEVIKTSTATCVIL